MMKMPIEYRVSGPLGTKGPMKIARLSSLADAKRALKARVNNED